MLYSYLVFFMPTLLIIYILYIFIYKEKKVSKLNIIIIGLGIIILITYYYPSKNILQKLDINTITISIEKGKGKNKEYNHFKIDNKEDIKSIVDIINGFHFRRSAFRTINKSENLASDGTSIYIFLHNHKQGELNYLFVVNDRPELNLLKLDSQKYNAINKDRLSKTVFNKLRDCRYKESN